MVISSTTHSTSKEALTALIKAYPSPRCLVCSSAGYVTDNDVSEGECVASEELSDRHSQPRRLFFATAICSEKLT